MSNHILHINSYYLGTYLHRIMISHLNQFDVKNKVFIPTCRKQINLSNSELECVSRCFNKNDRISYYYKQNKIYNALLKNIYVKDFDLVHAYTVFADGYSAYRLKKQYGIRYVVAVRDTDLNAFFKYRVYLRRLGIDILLNAEKVFFLSNPYMEELIGKYIPKNLQEEVRKKSCLMPNGIDDFWHQNEYQYGSKDRCLNRENTINILCAGRISRRKNIPTVQRAMDILEKKGYQLQLQLVGPIDNKRLFKSIMRHDKTKYHEPVKKEELISFYRQNDIFVLPSFTETFGLVYAEALSQGLPVVYSRGQGFDEQFPNGEVGYSVDSHDPKTVATAIESIIIDYGSLASRCVANSKRFVWNDICEKYYEIYCSILNSSND